MSRNQMKNKRHFAIIHFPLMLNSVRKYLDLVTLFPKTGSIIIILKKSGNKLVIKRKFNTCSTTF